MRQLQLILFLGIAAAAPLPYTPTCAVKATYTVQEYLPGRLVTITPIAACPKNGAAYVRFRSAGGIQPDAPPGFFTLRPGQRLTRRVPWDWWIESRDRVLRWNVVTMRLGGE